jgi:hypothetical protein
MIKIWGRPTSIHTQRVLWALADADLPYELTLASATMGPQGHVSKGGAPFRRGQYASLSSHEPKRYRANR